MRHLVASLLLTLNLAHAEELVGTHVKLVGPGAALRASNCVVKVGSVGRIAEVGGVKPYIAYWRNQTCHTQNVLVSFGTCELEFAVFDSCVERPIPEGEGVALVSPDYSFEPAGF